ncbi:unnamed protein product [Pelagomonas calceolata]|uniref:Uncharacterized protein n=1 Tax=Pelagomonas calceolata TaxID=35677 RepID=A0A8J2S703_9STRA|nr:unnamed protein product [Pelagomonas calceolata]
MDEADIPYLLDALASATGGLAAARAAAQLAECLASATGPELARAHAPALRALAPAALAARGAGDATLAHAATLCAVLASRACAAAAPRSRAEIAAVAELLRNAPAPAPRPSPSKRRRRRGFFAGGAAEQAAAVDDDAPSAELARCLAAQPSSSIRQAAGLLAELALRTRGRAREGGYYGARPVDDRGAARLAFGDAGGVEALAALGTDAGLEAAAAACAGCPPNVSRLRETALLPRALRLIRTSDAALRVVVDATHLHPPSTKLVGADGGLSALTAVSTEGAFDARLLALTALANCLEVDLENCRRFECAPLAARLASLLKTIGFEDDSDDWRVEDVLEAAHCAVPLACVARREAGRAKALAALTGAAVAPTALAKLLEALAVVQARSGALDRDAAAALAVLVRDLRKLFPGAPPTPEPKRARQQASPVGVESPTSDVVLPPPPPRTP